MRIEEKVSLKEWTWWKIGGLADHFCSPTTIDEAREAVEWSHEHSVPLTVLGGGTNVLVSDEGIEGLVLCTRRLVGVESAEANGRLTISALAGTPKSELTKLFLRAKLPPALFLCGLPGDVGGGVVMNAGIAEQVTPREFVEITDWVDVLHLQTLAVRRFTRGDLEWRYRHSAGWQPGLIVRVGVSWPLADADNEIPRKVKEATQNRLRKQPLDLPSCGSTFKNPDGAKAGALIDQAGLKGIKIGGAQVSPKHGNFIVNTGGATARDVRAIIAHVQSEVEKRFGVKLETEVKLLGR